MIKHKNVDLRRQVTIGILFFSL